MAPASPKNASPPGSTREQSLNKGVRNKRAHLTDKGATAFGSSLNVERWELGNGLTILLLVDPSAPVISYHTWYKVGSRYEEPGKTGLAHFFEHMMFNETKNLPYGEFDERMEDAGGDTNAATWIDWTYYYEALPAEELSLAIELESDRMANLMVRKAQVESEREVVANERRMAVEDDVQGAAGELLWALAFGKKHPHGWPTIGWMEDIEGYRVKDCREFYQTWYAPNNATIVITGDFDSDATLKELSQAYGRYKPSVLPNRPVKKKRLQRKERKAVLSWPTSTEKVLVAWSAPPYATFDHAIYEIVDELLTGGRSSRLRLRLQEELEIVSSLRGGVGGLEGGGLYEFYFGMREGHGADEAVAILDEELKRLATEPVSDAELEKVLNRVELYFLSEIETAAGKASQIGFAHTVTGDPSYGFTRLEDLRRVTSAQIMEIAALLCPEARSRVTILPAGAK